MSFLVGHDLDRAVEAILQEPYAQLAVAFLGTGAESYLQTPAGNGRRVVCNLTMGGTNPSVVAILQEQISVRHCDTLHAKVYIGKEWTVVTSANLSANGLGLDTDRDSGWQEAGVRIETSDEVLSWFSELWQSSQEVRKEDMDRAWKRWRSRRRASPPVRSLAHYEISDDFPLLSFFGNDRWEVCEDSVTEQVAHYNDEVYQWINDSLEIEHEDDLEIAKNRWVVLMKINNDGSVSAKDNLSWMLTGDRVIRQAYRYKDTGHTHDCLLTETTDGDGPFPISGTRFKEAFRAVINSPDYEQLRTDDRPHPSARTWYDEERLKLIKQLWLDVQVRLRAEPRQ